MHHVFMIYETDLVRFFILLFQSITEKPDQIEVD